MRARHFRASPCWSERIVDAPTEETPALATQEPEMSRGQMIALLDIRSGDAESLFAKALHCLRAVGSDEPTTADLNALRNDGYISWHAHARLDVMTPRGLAKAERIARKVAEDYKLHHISRTGGHASRTGAISRCTCGWSSGPHRLLRNVESVQARHENAHLDMVAKGTWKQPRPLEDFLNEVLPPRFDFRERRT